MSEWTRKNGVWQKTTQPSVRAGGIWRNAAAAWISKAGVWQKWWPDLPDRGGPYIFGHLTSVGPNIARYDGSVWSAVGGGLGTTAVGQRVNSLAVADDGTLLALGQFTTPYARRAYWNGSAWSDPMAGYAGTGLASELAFWTGSGFCFTDTPGTAGAYIRTASGSSPAYVYTVSTSGIGSAYYSGASFDATNGDYAFGNFSIPASNKADLVNGIGISASVTVTALRRQLDGKAWLGGYTSYPTSFVYRCDGANTWTRIGGATGFNGTISDVLALPDGRAWACGSFTSVDGVSANGIAEWNGSAWGAVGAGFTNASRMCFHRDLLWILRAPTFTTCDLYTWDGATLSLQSNWSGDTIYGIA